MSRPQKPLMSLQNTELSKRSSLPRASKGAGLFCASSVYALLPIVSGLALSVIASAMPPLPK